MKGWAGSATLTYTSGGTTWHDIACFAFTTAVATKRGHISRQQTLAISAPTIGTLADDTLRVAFTTTGTFATGTSISVSYQPA